MMPKHLGKRNWKQILTSLQFKPLISTQIKVQYDLSNAHSWDMCVSVCTRHWKPARFCLHGIHTIIIPSSCSSGSDLAIWAPFRMDLALWRKMGACCHSNAAYHSRSHDIGKEEHCRLMYTQSARFTWSEQRLQWAVKVSEKKQVSSGVDSQSITKDPTGTKAEAGSLRCTNESQ